MRLDEQLCMVVRIPRPGGEVFVHVSPLSREVFESHWLVISKTFTSLATEGLSIVGGPRVAGLALKQVAVNMGVWDGPSGVERTLVAEIIRLSNVSLPSPAGWQTLPMANALADGMFSDAEKSEVIGIAVFFIVLSAMHRRDVLETTMVNMGGLWGTRTTSSNATEFTASLPTSTVDESTGVRTPAASVPH